MQSHNNNGAIKDKVQSEQQNNNAGNIQQKDWAYSELQHNGSKAQKRYDKLQRTILNTEKIQIIPFWKTTMSDTWEDQAHSDL